MTADRRRTKAEGELPATLVPPQEPARLGGTGPYRSLSTQQWRSGILVAEWGDARCLGLAPAQRVLLGW
jgi:hypothetical protein